MMQRKTTIYISQEIENLERSSHNNFSGRLSNICDRFSEIIKKASPIKKFTYPEFGLLKECFKSDILKPAGLIETLVSKVSGHMQQFQSDLKFEVDSKQILAKLSGLNYVEMVSLVETIEDHWDKNQDK